MVSQLPAKAKAKDTLKSAVATAPPTAGKKDVRSRVRAMYKVAQSAVRSGRARDGIVTLQECVALDPKDSYCWLLLGRTVAQQGNPASAREIFESASVVCPDSVHIWQAWAVLEKAQGNLDRARSLFRHALEVDPGNAYVCHAWGLLELRSDPPNVDAARSLFRQAFDMTPQAQVCTALGGLEAAQGRVEEAREVFRKGIELCDEKGPIMLAWAEMEERAAGDFEAAERLLRSALEANKTDVKAHIAWAKLEMRRGCMDSAVKILLEAADWPQRDAQLFNMWATLEQRRGNLEAARAIVKRGRERFSGEQSLLQTQGMIMERLGELDEARELYRQSVEIRPTAPAYVAWAMLEDKLAAMGGEACVVSDEGRNDVQSAIEGRRSGKWEGGTSPRKLFEMGMVVDPSHGALYNAYGAMEERLGNVDAARAVLQRGIAARCSDMASVWHGLGSLELRCGDVDAARSLFTRGAAELGGLGEDASFLWHSLGMLELHCDRLVAARDAFAEGVRCYPRSSPLLLGSALAEMRIGETDTARHFFKDAVTADPCHAHAWQAWGVMEHREGHLDNARSLFERGLRAVPGHAALWVAYGLLESEVGGYDKARELFKAGIRACQRHFDGPGAAEGCKGVVDDVRLVRLFHAWACTEARAGDLEQARTLVRRAIGMAPTDGSCWTTFGVIEQRRAMEAAGAAPGMDVSPKLDLSLSRRVYQLGLRACPEHGPLYASYGLMELRRGNYSEARSLFERGLVADPRHAPLYHHLAELEALHGDIQALAELNSRAKELFPGDFSKTTSVLQKIGTMDRFVQETIDHTEIEVGLT
jgi:tetratricopeptide (TPR) repeat protein